jgi:hypothetical protein
VSSVPAVKAALVTVLTAALPASQVIYGPIESVSITTPRVLSVEGAVGTRDMSNLALTSATENYTITLMVSVMLPGYQQQTADEQALADYEAACDAITAAGADLGLGNGANICPEGQFELSEFATANGRAAQVRFSVSVFNPAY